MVVELRHVRAFAALCFAMGALLPFFVNDVTTWVVAWFLQQAG